MTALAYSSLRGFGAVHPTLGEFRVGYLPVEVEHPHTGEAVEVGEILCTEVEAVGREMGYGGEGPADDEDGDGRGPSMALGYGLVFGRNERKAISMAILDAAMRVGREREAGPGGPAEDEEFVLYHTDGIEATGFVEHLKLPHYVTFQSSLDRLREVRGEASEVLREEAHDG
jgi:alpha-D-ribose 1-methylphosphonate 5-triphosphate synthase subunit PhnI